MRKSWRSIIILFGFSDAVVKITNVFPPIFFFFNDTATTEIYTLSLHDALPFSIAMVACTIGSQLQRRAYVIPRLWLARVSRSGEHTSELQSHVNLVCRLLL